MDPAELTTSFDFPLRAVRESKMDDRERARRQQVAETKRRQRKFEERAKALETAEADMVRSAIHARVSASRARPPAATSRVLRSFVARFAIHDTVTTNRPRPFHFTLSLNHRRNECFRSVKRNARWRRRRYTNPPRHRLPASPARARGSVAFGKALESPARSAAKAFRRVCAHPRTHLLSAPQPPRSAAACVVLLPVIGARGHGATWKHRRVVLLGRRRKRLATKTPGLPVRARQKAPRRSNANVPETPRTASARFFGIGM